MGGCVESTMKYYGAERGALVAKLEANIPTSWGSEHEVHKTSCPRAALVGVISLVLESDAAEIRGRVLCPISAGRVSLASEMGVSVFELLQYDATETSNQSGERRVQK